jgi:methionine sulfoxide reductase heme-binding subunit
MTSIESTLVTTTRSSARRHTAGLVSFGILIASLIAATVFLVSGTGIDGWRIATRLTARFSFFVFLTAFIARPLAQSARNGVTRSLLRERRGVGLAFAGAHTVHLGVFLGYFAVGGTVPPPVVVVLGSVAYVLIGLMAATSNDWSVARFGAKKWRRLHAFGMYYVWLIFALTYLSRVSRGPLTIVDNLLLALAVAAFLLRLAAPFLRSIRA